MSWHIRIELPARPAVPWLDPERVAEHLVRDHAAAGVVEAAVAAQATTLQVAPSARPWSPHDAERIWCATRGVLARVVLEQLHHGVLERRFRARTYREAQARPRAVSQARRILKQPRFDGKIRAEIRRGLDDVFADALGQRPALHLPIDGFIRFRLRRGLQCVETALAEAQAGLEREAERSELMLLLKQLVAEDELHGTAGLDVVRGPGDRFILLDEAGRIVESEYLSADVFDLADSEQDRLDLLFSALITKVPERIRCHFACEPALRAQLRDLFGAQVQFCTRPGCKLCGSRMIPMTPALDHPRPRGV
ncbi:MAG TPA: sporulation protein YtxC [Limnochordia bacterium]|nr:sporulation protein YtxC [Limnochordia bacterium]